MTHDEGIFKSTESKRKKKTMRDWRQKYIYRRTTTLTVTLVPSQERLHPGFTLEFSRFCPLTPTACDSTFIPMDYGVLHNVLCQETSTRHHQTKILCSRIIRVYVHVNLNSSFFNPSEIALHFQHSLWLITHYILILKTMKIMLAP